MPRVESDDYYNFVDGAKIRRIAVDADQRRRILNGDLIIVRCEGRYNLVPADAAARIRERDERAVLPPPAATARPRLTSRPPTIHTRTSSFPTT